MNLVINKLFIASILSSIAIWLLVFLVLPVKVVQTLNPMTILFITANYLALILGYFVINFKESNTIKNKPLNITKTVMFLIVLMLFSYGIRFIDLFMYRGLGFHNTIMENRTILEQYGESVNLFFIIASILKSLYFFPIIILVSIKEKQKTYLYMLSLFILCLPLVEGLLKGTRKPFFELFLILLFSILVFRKIKLTKIKVFGFIGISIILLVISNRILFAREQPKLNNKDYYTEMLNARYNDFLPPNDVVKNYITNVETNEIKKQSMLIALHSGQYIAHGFFEFNYLFSLDNLPISYGAYSFGSVRRFFNMEYVNPSPREYVYLTAFGDLYLDFRWFSVCVMFLFGIFQKLVFQRAIISPIWRPLLIYLLIINVFLLVVNYLSEAGIYPLIGFFGILLLINLPVFKLHEKSVST